MLADRAERRGFPFDRNEVFQTRYGNPVNRDGTNPATSTRISRSRVLSAATGCRAGAAAAIRFTVPMPLGQ
jgi:hypothetical protein